ncbi:MAG: hypothetical protein ABEK59_03800 [Halobacteria archaeon]
MNATGDLNDEDIPPELEKSFWQIVMLLNVALLTLSAGVMMLYFTGDIPISAGLLLVGYIALARAILRYKKDAPRNNPRL